MDIQLHIDKLLGDKVSISKTDFISEHTHLVDVLRNGTQQEREKEANEQESELQEELTKAVYKDNLLVQDLQKIENYKRQYPERTDFNDNALQETGQVIEVDKMFDNLKKEKPNKIVNLEVVEKQKKETTREERRKILNENFEINSDLVLKLAKQCYMEGDGFKTFYEKFGSLFNTRSMMYNVCIDDYTINEVKSIFEKTRV